MTEAAEVVAVLVGIGIAATTPFVLAAGASWAFSAPGCEDALLSSSSYDVTLTCPEPTFQLRHEVDVYGVRADCRCPAGILEPYPAADHKEAP